MEDGKYANVKSMTESEAWAVARWGGWVVCKRWFLSLNRWVLSSC